MRRIVLLLLATLAPTAAAADGIGTGWSRAPDVSVFAAMNHIGAVAREQSVLCWNRDPAWVDARWQRRYGARHASVTAAMNARYGAEELERARLGPGPSVPCEEIISDRWWKSYDRLLRLLEIRLSDRRAG